jgi:hypothetical protein
MVNGRFQKVSDPAASTQTARNTITDNNVLIGNADYSGAGFGARRLRPLNDNYSTEIAERTRLQVVASFGND